MTPGVGVLGNGNTGDGVQGSAANPHRNGVFGRNDSTTPRNAADPGGNGVFGFTQVPDGAGVFGAHNTGGVGVAGLGHIGVIGGNNGDNSGVGVLGNGNTGDGMQGFTTSESRNGIFGRNTSTSAAPSGGAPAGNGVFGFTDVPNASGVVGAIGPNNTTGAGVTGIGNNSGAMAGLFFGNVQVTGDIFLPGADCAEQFDIATVDGIEPGTVMVINDQGALAPSQQAYDKTVAGVISGAGKFKHGIVLDKQLNGDSRMPLALLGKVCCKVDAGWGPIKVGDLLTTSPTVGHAMKAEDREKAFGSVIGKALSPMNSGRGLMPILIALQ